MEHRKSKIRTEKLIVMSIQTHYYFKNQPLFPKELKKKNPTAQTTRRKRIECRAEINEMESKSFTKDQQP